MYLSTSIIFSLLHIGARFQVQVQVQEGKYITCIIAADDFYDCNGGSDRRLEEREGGRERERQKKKYNIYIAYRNF